MNTIRLKYNTPKSAFILKTIKHKIRLLSKAKSSYAIRKVCLIICLKMGKKPKIQRLMYRRVNTFDVLFNLDDSKIEAKKIAFIDVGFPMKTFWLSSGWTIIFLLLSFFTDDTPDADFSAVVPTCGFWV